MPNAINYQQALHKLDSARGQIVAIASTLKLIGESFGEWEQTDPDQLNGKLERALTRWPSREDVQAAVRTWQETMDAWNSLAQTDRIGLRTPHEMKKPG